MSRPPENSSPLGFIRDKTSIYVNFRSQSYHNVPPDLSSPMLTTDPLGPRADSSLVRRADTIDSQFITLDNSLTELRALYDERLRPSFDSRVSIDVRIEAETSRISQLITRVRDDIRGTARSPSGQRHHLEKAMQQGHASRLRAFTLQFREMQTAYLTRLQASEHRPTDDSDSSIDVDVTFNSSQVGQIQAQRQDIEERNAQIRRLLPMISQLTEMFADLGTLIVEQGTMLDRIDGHLEAALDDMRAGNVDLRKAEGDQKSSTKWFICYMVLMIVLILILGTVILIRKGNKEEEPEATPSS
jgi:syntaxin 16